MARLQGMKEITAYHRRSESTILILIRTEGFPATKVGGGWDSDTELIDEWLKKKIIEDTETRNSKNGDKKKPVKHKKR